MIMRSEYKSTHYFLTEQFQALPDLYIHHLISKKHQVRKIQDQLCYIHAKLNDHKIFSPYQHKRLESVIRNNLKLIVIEFLSPLGDSEYYTRMVKEALVQKTMLKRMNFNQLFFNRVSHINYFLNYSYSRSYEYFLKNERYSPEYAQYVVGFPPEPEKDLCPSK